MEESNEISLRERLTYPFAQLTIKEIIVLYLQSKGLTYPMIEKRTGIKVNTIKSIIRRKKSQTSDQYLSIARHFLQDLQRKFDPELE